MGKVTMRMYDSEESHERIKKKKRKKDLEELRRNALAAKRNMLSRPADLKKSKTSLMKCLNEFAAKRAEIENVVQSQDSLIKKTKIISETILPEPLNTKGFFLGGVKGKLLTRPSDSQKKIKDAILHSDALKLLQSGGYNYSVPDEKEKHTTENNVDSQTKMNIAKFFEDSSESSSCTDDSRSIKNVVKSSPILGGIKRKVRLVKLDGDTRAKNFSSKKYQSPVIKPFAKEEKCKRRLFEDENIGVNSRNSEYNNDHFDNIAPIRFSPRKSTPENVIFFTDQIPHKDVDNRLNNKNNNHKINPLNPKLIKCYVQICKMIAEKDLKNIFCHNVKDPMEITKAALRNTYANAFKEYIHQQKTSVCEESSHSVNRTTISDNSKIMLEPDSAIARILKKNSELKIKDPIWISENNSDVSTNFDDLRTNFSTSLFTIENNLKRKHVCSSKGEQSDAEIPSSIKVNADPESARTELKMDCIHPERQELIARYLKDVDTNNTHEKERSIFDIQRNCGKEFNNHKLEKDKLYVNDNVKSSFLIHKNTKHIPAILRKNRALVDCISRDKILLSIEKYPKIGDPVNKPSLLDFDSDSSLKSERTPNCGNSTSNQLMEAPKCKYMYMNAKYNQPSRINIPLMQNKRFQRNVAPERHLFPSPNNVEKHFVVNQTFELSPLKEQLHFADIKQDFHRCRLSQESSEQDNKCMTRMTSFGDIQERANRLTLCSSQNCSQESMERMYSSQEERYNLQPNYYYQQNDNSKNHMDYNNRTCIAYNKIPSSQSFSIALKPNYDGHSHNVKKCNEQASCMSANDFQILQPKDYIFKRTENSNCCLTNDCQMCRKQLNQRHNQGSLMNSLPLQQQNVCQPVKFIAIEENRVPQRRPIYNANDANSCPFIHKPSIPSHQFNQIIKPCFTSEILNQEQCLMPSIQLHSQGAPQSIISSDFKYDNIHKVGNITASNAQKLSNLNNEFFKLSRNSIHFAPNSISNQTLITQHNMPIHSAVGNKKYIGQHMQKQFPSSLYSQVGYQPNHYNNNEDYKINDDYQNQMNHFIHSNRP
ncbi:PREDICTED: uncharacterized protein LOC105364806 [Ceratosolen solmsi marchali]|uniref:Uncharacterized protein LOC105364806 n=1 Tax=Ceratosolen solmsi marchali TaxID=326594 RepID=A0AAJ6YN45_9HYME|nr:PREDICTED: uncharacterized protein LOC105364806 [Ceratosolen solmsi marchali]